MLLICQQPMRFFLPRVVGQRQIPELIAVLVWLSFIPWAGQIFVCNKSLGDKLHILWTDNGTLRVGNG